ncbi:MAG: hypothetical protein D6714_06955 [Bacteroidetes bacterium]|nr:MAG: hypothetical protein D6714_06955 [Bacteroidota bacterium]
MKFEMTGRLFPKSLFEVPGGDFSPGGNPMPRAFSLPETRAGKCAESRACGRGERQNESFIFSLKKIAGRPVFKGILQTLKNIAKTQAAEKRGGRMRYISLDGVLFISSLMTFIQNMAQVIKWRFRHILLPLKFWVQCRGSNHFE